MASRSEALLLYGRKRVPRSHRRVMLTLLTGAPDLGIADLMRLAQCGSWPAIRVTLRMERLGWAGKSHFGEFRRASWQLNAEGRACVIILLALPPEPWKDNGNA